MPSYIVRTSPDEEKYFMWSTIVDAPTTYLMTRGELKEYLHTGQRQDLLTISERLEQTDRRGTSAMPPFDSFRFEDGEDEIYAGGEDIGRPFYDEDDTVVKHLRWVNRDEVVAYLRSFDENS